MAEPYVIDRVLSCLPQRSKKVSILDIACGQGYIVERLEMLGFSNLHAADISRENFKLNKKQFHFRCVDANEKLPYTTNSFDVVISSETIEHLENPRQFIREIQRILKPGGQFILTTPSVESIVSRLYFLCTGRLAFHTNADYEISGHITVLPSWLIERFCCEAGFAMNEKTYSSFYVPILKMRITHPWFLRSIFGWIVIYSFKNSSSRKAA